MRKSFLRLSVLALAVAGGLATVESASASPWSVAHPRRAEVNARLGLQSARIDFKRATGQITPFQAHMLHRQDRIIHRETRFMAAMNGGYITKGEQRFLNRQENRVSRRIAQ